MGIRWTPTTPNGLTSANDALLDFRSWFHPAEHKQILNRPYSVCTSEPTNMSCLSLEISRRWQLCAGSQGQMMLHTLYTFSPPCFKCPLLSKISISILVGTKLRISCPAGHRESVPTLDRLAPPPGNPRGPALAFKKAIPY